MGGREGHRSQLHSPAPLPECHTPEESVGMAVSRGSQPANRYLCGRPLWLLRSRSLPSSQAPSPFPTKPLPVSKASTHLQGQSEKNEAGPAHGTQKGNGQPGERIRKRRRAPSGILRGKASLSHLRPTENEKESHGHRDKAAAKEPRREADEKERDRSREGGEKRG